MKRINSKVMNYSVVVPVFNEEGAVYHLGIEILEAMQKIGSNFEIIIIDDGSTDSTVAEAKRIPNAKIIQMRMNSGQSVALDVGIKTATGSTIITLDGDGQNDPADIAKMLKLLSHKIDVVCGWRKNRRDDATKRWVSLGAAKLRAFLVDDGIHDAGCTLRVYKRECFDGLDLEGEMHRMIPAILKWRGFKLAETVVNHRPRQTGQTKYGPSRILRGLLDMITVWFERKYTTRPLHLFGTISLVLIVSSTFLLLYLAYMKIVYGYQLSDKIWPLVGMNFLLAGLQLLTFGLLANLVRKNNTKPRPWLIKK